MFSLKVSAAVITILVISALAVDDHDHDHDHHDDHTHAPTLSGKCPDFPSIASLDISKLSGDWFGTYGLKKGFDDDHDHIIKCVKQTIAVQSDGSFESNVFMNKDGHDKKEKCIAKPLDGETAQFSVIRDSKEEHGKEITLTILDTDNTGFLICTVCISDGDKHGYAFQVYSRQKTLPDTDLEKAKAILKKLNVNDNLDPIEQTC